MNRMDGTNRASIEGAGGARFERVSTFWNQALDRQKVVDGSEWRKAS